MSGQVCSGCVSVPENDIALYLTPKQICGGRIRLINEGGQVWGHSPLPFLAKLAGMGLFGGLVRDGRLRAIQLLDEERFVFESTALAGFNICNVRLQMRSLKRKFCDRCRRDLRRDQFAKRLQNVDGLDHRCLYCRHRESALEAERCHNLRRVRELHADGSHTLSEWMAVLKQFKFHCVCCGLHAAEIDGVLTKDHIIPISQGGSNWISNIQPLCRSCNSRKGARIIDYRDNFLKEFGSIHPVSDLPSGDSGREGQPRDVSGGPESVDGPDCQGRGDRDRVAQPDQAA